MRSDTAFPLSPLGSARQQTVPAQAYPARLLSELRDADLGEEEAFLAWQMGQLASEIGEAERRDLASLVARSLISASQGSTRTRLAAVEAALARKATARSGRRASASRSSSTASFSITSGSWFARRGWQRPSRRGLPSLAQTRGPSRRPSPRSRPEASRH